MALQPFDLAALTELDGCRIRTAFDLALARLTEDCKDRPAVKARRSVTLTVSLIPVPNDEGDLGSVDVDCQLNEKIPKNPPAPPMPGPVARAGRRRCRR